MFDYLICQIDHFNNTHAHTYISYHQSSRFGSCLTLPWYLFDAVQIEDTADEKTDFIGFLSSILQNVVILAHAYAPDPTVKTWSHFLPHALKAVKEEAEGRKHWTNALKWKIWSFHLPPLLFARLLLQSWSAEEQMFSQTWRRGASVLMGMALPPLTADASTWQLLDFMELLRSH